MMQHPNITAVAYYFITPPLIGYPRRAQNLACGMGEPAVSESQLSVAMVRKRQTELMHALVAFPGLH